MALTKNTPRVFEQGDRNEFPMAATTTIYEGSPVGLNAGYARALVAGDLFVGFAEAKADNATGGAGDKTVRVKDEGKVVLAVSGAAITDAGKPVYASADDTFTFTATSNSYIGRVVRYISSGVVLVAFEKDCGGLLTALVDSSGGAAANGTIEVLADAGGTAAGAPTTASVANALAELATKVNAIIQILK